VFFIAWRNLLTERTRVALTLVGVTFAVVLMFFDIGAYLGFVRASSVLIDHAEADIWVTLENSRNFDASRPFPERKLWKARQIKGVANAEPMAKGWGQMKLKSGSTETVMIVGFDPDAGLGLPWKLRDGSVRRLKVDDTVIIDESSIRRLEGLGMNETVEIADIAVKVVGVSEEVKSFTTYPTLFANYETAKRLAGAYRLAGTDQTTFILVNVANGYSVADVAQRLRQIGGVAVYAKDEFSRQTQNYWIVQTGMGVGFGLTALLGFAVGMVIVGQTIYSSTLERLREYGTLKAIGASSRELVNLIACQAVVYAICGYIAGVAIMMMARPAYEGLGLKLVTTPAMGVAMLGITVLMCLGASIASARKALSVDPATVFRG
jgi:putative ABC transport system permease protein